MKSQRFELHDDLMCNLVSIRTKKNAPGRFRGALPDENVENRQAFMALTRLVNRETLREAAFLWITPFWALRISSG